MVSIAQLYEIYNDASEFYHGQLLNAETDDSDKAFTYLCSRVSAGSIFSWKLGYASNGGGLYRHLSQKYSADSLLYSGLIQESGMNWGDYYDYFRNRIIMPIWDISGKIIAFAGRSNDENEIKFMNSSESPIYKKSQTLFGMDRAYRAIRKKKQAIIVEGYFDAIVAHEYGIDNCIATCGVAFTPEHLKIISRAAEEITFCFDGDKAGFFATCRAGKFSLEQGIPITVIPLQKCDPDEYLKQHGKDKFLELAKNKLSLVDFAIQYHKLKEIKNPDEIHSKISAIYPLIDATKSPLQRHLWLQKISSELNMDEKLILDDYRAHLTGSKPKKKKSSRPVEEYVLGYLLSNPISRRLASNIFKEDDFSKPEYGYFFKFLCSTNSIDDLVLNPGIDFGESPLFSSLKSTDVISEFKKYCKERDIIIYEEQLSSLQGILMQSLNHHEIFMGLFEKAIIEKKLVCIEREIKLCNDFEERSKMMEESRNLLCRLDQLKKGSEKDNTG